MGLKGCVDLGYLSLLVGLCGLYGIDGLLLFKLIHGFINGPGHGYSLVR